MMNKYEAEIFQAQLHMRLRDKMRYIGQGDFSGLALVEDKEINRAIWEVFRFYCRSSEASHNQKKQHPKFREYCACLSEGFANDLLVKARKLGYLPKYNKRKAEKWQIADGRSYIWGIG